MTTARERASELADQLEAIGLHQFENDANADSHYRTTAEEILDSVGDREIDAFVAGVGTGGTITGTADRLLEAFPGMEVVAVEPARNPVLSTGEPGEDAYQGMGPGFVSELLDVDLIDAVETVALEDAEAECRRLAREEAILAGQSSGAASIAATRVAERLARPELDCPQAPAAATDPDAARTDGGDGGSNGDYDDCPLVVTVFPDSGERYLSTGMFD
jgi:cysteine synthase A